MITLFNKFKFNHDDGLKIGDYVKIKKNSHFYTGYAVYHIDRLDKISAYLSDINGKYPGYMFAEITRKHLMKLSDSEKAELDFILTTKKYNL